MDPSVKATRTAIAQNRVTVAASAVAERYGLTDQLTAVQTASAVRADVRPLYQMEAVADLLDAIVASEGVEAEDASPESELLVLESVNARTARLLTESGYTNVVALREASDDDLVAISGIGAATVRAIRAEIGQPEGAGDEDALPEPDEPIDDAEATEAEPE